MSRKEFAFLLQQYLAGKCTAQEKEFVEQWFGLLENENRQELTDAGFEELEPLMWEQIRKKRDARVAENPEPVQRLFPWKRVGRAAAAVLLVGLAGWVYTARFSGGRSVMPPGEVMSGWNYAINNTDSSRWLRLADGSRVQLEPHSSLRYPAVFSDKKREIVLSGAGYFDITRDASRPFYVHTDLIVTRVLGTSFRIRTSREKEVSVEVMSGSVAVSGQSNAAAVFAKALPGEVILSPNQKTVYSVENRAFVKGLVARPKLLPAAVQPEEINSFNFEEVALETVLDRLGKAYGIHIELENPLQKNCPLRADLNNLSLYEQLDMVCAATRSHYVVEGTQIRFTGPGCDSP